MRHTPVLLVLLAVVAGCGSRDAGTGTWTPVKSPIQTPWTAEVSPENVHPEYPRPQMVRERWASLNGLWNYAVVEAEDPQPRYWDGRYPRRERCAWKREFSAWKQV